MKKFLIDKQLIGENFDNCDNCDNRSNFEKMTIIDIVLSVFLYFVRYLIMFGLGIAFIYYFFVEFLKNPDMIKLLCQ